MLVRSFFILFSNKFLLGGTFESNSSKRADNSFANSLLCLFESISLICVFLIKALRITFVLFKLVKYDLGIFFATSFCAQTLAVTVLGKSSKIEV